MGMAGSESELDSFPAFHTKQQLLGSFPFTDLLLRDVLIPPGLRANTEKPLFSTKRHDTNTLWIAKVVIHATRNQR